MNFNTPYNRLNFLVGENYKKIKSCTQPEQVLPLKRILDGLRNGSIILNAQPLAFDIPEHEIEFEQGTTATATNANLNAAITADLAESAEQAGENITARPGFTIEDAQPTIDAVEDAIIANAERESGKPAPASRQAGDERSSETFAANTDSTVSGNGQANDSELK